GADPRPRVELRLRRGGERRRGVRLLPAPQGRHDGAAAPAHVARCRLRAAGAERRMSESRATSWAARKPLRVKPGAALIALLALGITVSGVAAWFAMRGYLVGQVDQNLVGAPAGLVQQVGGALDHLGSLSTRNCPGGPGAPSPYAFLIENSSGTWTCPATD